MSGRPKIEITESAEELRSLLKKQKTALNYAKIQALYLLKIQAVETVRSLAVLMGRGESLIHEWLGQYKNGGLDQLLEERPKTGSPKKLAIALVIFWGILQKKWFIVWQDGNILLRLYLFNYFWELVLAAGTIESSIPPWRVGVVAPFLKSPQLPPQVL